MTAEEMTQLAINTIRRLSIDAVQAAKSGHPATPMALAPLIYTIWNRVMRFDPEARSGLNRRSFRPVEWPRFHAASVSTPSNKGGERQLRKPRAGVGISLDALRDIFEHQTQEYRDSVLPSHVKVRVAVEQASSFGWERYVGRAGCVIGMKTFGASAPLKELQRKFGFEPDQVVTVAKDLLSRSQRSHASVAA